VAFVRTDISQERIVTIIKVTSNVPSSPILVTLMMEAIRSAEMLVVTLATRRNIPKDDFLRSGCLENLKSYKELWIKRC
jgi:hypothetical protein